MTFKKIAVPLAIGMLSTIVACGGTSKPENSQKVEKNEIADIKTYSKELDSANVELDKEVSDLKNSLKELNSEN